MKQLVEINLRHSYKAKFDNSSYAFYALLFSCLFILSTHTNLALADAKIVKWKDANGVTHYGDKMPAQEAGRSNSVLNNQGTVIKTNESFNPSINKQETERISTEQTRKDSALLASYSSVEEIDLAQARNIKSDQLALKSLHQRLNELQVKIKVTNSKYAGKKMPQDLIEEQKANNAQIIKLQSDIAASEYSIAQTVNRFEGYKARYIELRPRDQTLTYIKANKKTLAELEAWKADASERLNSLLNKSISYKRAGEIVPDNISQGITQTNSEIARASEEIIIAKSNIEKSQQTFSK